MNKFTPRDEILGRVRERLVEGAARFAAAEKSDPFAFSRAMTHINGGTICRQNSQGEISMYDAEIGSETRRLPDGTEYQAVIYRNLVRP